MHLFEQLALMALAVSVSAWDSSQMPEKQRKELCAEQVLYCTNVCGGEGFTREAFCNPTTLGSKCQCSNGAEAAIRRYQWPAFQRVCEAQRDECRMACDRSKIPAHEKSYCFNSCDYRLACGTDDAPDLKVMVQKFDDPTGNPKPKPKEDKKDESSGKTDSAGADAASKSSSDSTEKKESKIKERKGEANDAPKRRGGPLNGTSGSSSAAVSGKQGSAALAVVLSAAALAAVAAKGRYM